MERIKYVLIIISFLFSITAIQAATTGFDEICRIYTEAKNSSMSKKQLADYINNNIARRVNNKDATTTHSIIPQVSPPVRYRIFKESAEYSLKKKWDCAAIKEIMK